MKTLGISRQALAAALVGAVVMGGLAIAPKVFTPEAGAQPIMIEAPRGAPLSFADLIDRVEPAVVSVNVVTEREVGALADVEQFFEQFRGMPGLDDFLEERRREEEDEPQTREGRSLGSGFFISEDGYVVTNNHVVENATEIEIVLKDGRDLDARLVGTDPQTDLAVLQVTEGGSYPYVSFGDSRAIRKGDWVVALGNPFGLGGTATAGILSADGRELGNDSPYTDFLQIDASINRGNSGGPTFDLSGNVVGVNTAIFSPTGGSVGIGFAIPAELAQDVTQEIIKNGRVSRGWLGVSIMDLSEDMAEALGEASNEGAIVADVQRNSPAEKGGLKRGDVILSVNGQKVTDATSTTRVVGKLIANTVNDFDIIRKGERQIVSVTVGERPDNPNAVEDSPRSNSSTTESEEGTRLDEFGVTFELMHEGMREQLGLGENETGLVITDIEPDGMMAKAGFVEGMVILEVAYEPASSVEAFTDAIDEVRRKGDEKVLLTVRVGRATLFQTIDLGEEE